MPRRPTLACALTLALAVLVPPAASAAVDSVAPLRPGQLTGGDAFVDPAGATHLALYVYGEPRDGRQRRCLVYATDRGGDFSHDTVACFSQPAGAPAPPTPAVAVRFGRPFVAWVRPGRAGVAVSKRDRPGARWRTDAVRRVAGAPGTHDAGLQVNVEANRARVSWSRCQPGTPAVCRIAYAVRSGGADFRVLTVDTNAGPRTALALGRLPYVVYRLAGRDGQVAELRVARITRTGGRTVAVTGSATGSFDAVVAPEGLALAYRTGRRAGRRVTLAAGQPHGPFRRVAPRLRTAGGPLRLVRSAPPGGTPRVIVAHEARGGAPGPATRPALSAFDGTGWTTRLVAQQGVDDFRPLALAVADGAQRLTLAGSCSVPTLATRTPSVCLGRGTPAF